MASMKQARSSTAPRLSRALIVGNVLVGLLLVLTQSAELRRLAPSPIGSMNAGYSSSTGGEHRGQCAALREHERGRWRHVRLDGENASAVVDVHPAALESNYMPLEIEWLRGRQRPADWTKRGVCAEFKKKNTGIMYGSNVGNQCGCGVTGFRPSHSAWIRDGGGGSEARAETRAPFDSPSLRLMRDLARTNRSLCFVGDSIDKQFYSALRNNLRRINHLQNNTGLQLVVEERVIPVNYTNETGYSSCAAWRKMDSVFRTDLTIGNLSTSFSFFKMYGWWPVHTSFTDDCSIIIANLGLHYDSNTMELSRSSRLDAALASDLRAVVSYLLDHASRGEGRSAVWRSALPQHFRTSDRHHRAGRACSFKPLREGNESVIQNLQNYNRAYDAAFDEFCTEAGPSDCGEHICTCTVNLTSSHPASLYSFYVGTNCCRERLEGLRRPGGENLTGRILRWNAFDLFDVPTWHASDDDCSHFCYVPALYEEAFERLRMLLTWESGRESSGQ